MTRDEGPNSEGQEKALDKIRRWAQEASRRRDWLALHSHIAQLRLLGAPDEWLRDLENLAAQRSQVVGGDVDRLGLIRRRKEAAREEDRGQYVLEAADEILDVQPDDEGASAWRAIAEIELTSETEAVRRSKGVWLGAAGLLAIVIAVVVVGSVARSVAPVDPSASPPTQTLVAATKMTGSITSASPTLSALATAEISSTTQAGRPAPIRATDTVTPGFTATSTSSPTATAALTPRPTATATSTSTSSPTATAALNPRPTARPTAAPSPPTRRWLLAPVLTEPDEGAVFVGASAEVLLAWQPVGRLATDEYYVVVVEAGVEGGGVWTDLQQTKETQVLVPRYLVETWPTTDSRFTWWVGVRRLPEGVRAIPAKPGEPMGDESERRTFVWRAGTGPGPKPTATFPW